MIPRIGSNILHVLIVWVVLGALIPRESALRLLYLFNTYAALPLTLLLLLMLRLGRSNYLPAFRPGLADLAMVLFVAVALASILFAHASDATKIKNLVELHRTFVVPFTAFWLVRIARPGEKQLAAWVPLLAGLCIFEAISGALGLFLPAALPSFWPGFVIATDGVRIIGTLTQPDCFAAFLIFAATFCFYFLGSKPVLSARLFGYGLLVLGFSAGFISFSRASWLGGVVVLGLLAFAYRKLLIIPVMTIALMVSMLAGIHVDSGRDKAGPGASGAAADAPSPLTPAGGKSYASERLGTGRSIADRVILLAAGLKMFLEKPWLGWGFGSYDLHARDFVQKTGPFEPSSWARDQGASHNSHVSILAELGILGYTCLAFPLLWALVRSAKALRRPTVAPLLVTLWANLAFLAVVSMSIDLRFLASMSGLAWLILGLADIRAEQHERPC